MYTFESATASHSALHSAPVSAPPRSEAKLLYFPAEEQAQESLSISNRGIVLGGLLSSALWAALILAARELWLFLR